MERTAPTHPPRQAPISWRSPLYRFTGPTPPARAETTPAPPSVSYWASIGTALPLRMWGSFEGIRAWPRGLLRGASAQAA